MWGKSKTAASKRRHARILAQCYIITLSFILTGGFLQMITDSSPEGDSCRVIQWRFLLHWEMCRHVFFLQLSSPAKENWSSKLWQQSCIFCNFRSKKKTKCSILNVCKINLNQSFTFTLIQGYGRHEQEHPYKSKQTAQSLREDKVFWLPWKEHAAQQIKCANASVLVKQTSQM